MFGLFFEQNALPSWCCVNPKSCHVIFLFRRCVATKTAGRRSSRRILKIMVIIIIFHRYVAIFPKKTPRHIALLTNTKLVDDDDRR